MSNDRSNMIEKIKALLSKTTDNGCTEAEMEAALAKASAMMEVYEISQADLELTKQEKAAINRIHTGKHKIEQYLGNSVAEFTHTKVWKSGDSLTFCGLPLDIDFASFLLKSLTSFTEREMVDYLAKTPHSRGDTRALINGFTIGCTNRIAARLRALCAASVTVASTAKTGNALAIVQNAAVADYMKENGIQLGKARRSSARAFDGGAFASGRAAGDRASFGRGIGSGGSLRLS